MKLLALLVASAIVPPLAAAQLSTPFPLPGDSSPAAPAGHQTEPALARGGEAFLMVWEDTRIALTETAEDPANLYAMRYDENGQPLDVAPIVISQAPYGQTDPCVSWNGSNWLVVYTSERWVGSTTTRGVYAKRVGPDGSVLDVAPILIDDTEFVQEDDVSVTSDGDVWIVCWNDENPGYYTSRQRKLRRIADSGALLNGAVLYDVPGNNFPQNAQIAFGGGKILFVANSQGLTLNVIGLPVDAVSLLPVGPQVTFTAQGTNPVVASDGTDFYVSWRVDEVFDSYRGTTYSNAGVVGTPGGSLIATEPTQVSDLEPQVAWDGDHYWLVVDPRSGGGPVDGYRLDSTGALVDVSPVALSPSGEADNSTVVGGPAAGTLFAAWQSRSLGFEDLRGSRTVGAVTTQIGDLEHSLPNQIESDLAGGMESGYLVVFLSRQSGSSRIMGLRLDGHGQPITGAPFEIVAGFENLHTPRVAWNGEHWLVVWERWPTIAGGVGAVVQFRRVAPDESLPDGVATALSGNWPDVAALGEDFLIAASRQTSLDIRRVWAVRVAGTGVVAGASELVGDDYSDYPRVASVGAKWIVAWRQKPNHNSSSGTPRFRFVDADGLASSVPTALGGGTERVDLSVMEDHFTIVASGGDAVAGHRFSSDGTPVADSFITVADEHLNQFGPVIGNNGHRFLAAWNDFRIHTVNSEGIGDVVAARFEETGALLGPELVVSADMAAAEVTGAIAGDERVTVMTYHRLITDGGINAWRTFVRVIDESDCQADLGSPGPGSSVLSLCGTGLASGQSSDLLLAGAPPMAINLFVIGLSNSPVPVFGGTLVPGDVFLSVWKATDLKGEVEIRGLPGGNPLMPTLYIQALTLDAPIGGNVVFSNTIAAQFLP